MHTLSYLTQLRKLEYLHVCYADTPKLVIPLRMKLGKIHTYTHTQIVNTQTHGDSKGIKYEKQ